VISLLGNGMDCHRTWEALGLGATVITSHSPIDNLLKDYRVIFLPNENWETYLNNEEWLRAEQTRVSALPLPSLSTKHWLAKIRTSIHQ
jgi:hypothetical protein